MKTILLIDDESSIVEVLARLLEDEGFALLTASSGRAALERVTERVPDLIITDEMMPLMRGSDLFRALRKLPALLDVPIILISAVAMATAADLPWAARLSKPFEFDQLLREIRRVLRKAE